MSAKQAHLEMIQGIINRLSHKSFLLKGWSVILVSALFALAAKDSKALFIYLAYFPAIAFWFLDGYFLSKERLYRNLFDAVRVLNEDNIDYSMDASGLMNSKTSWRSSAFSFTLILFHGAVVFMIALILFTVF